MKTVWLLGLMAALLTVAYNNLGSVARARAQSPDRFVITPVLADAEIGDRLPARFSEYLFLHQTRIENFPVHAIADVKTCSE